MKNSNTNYDLDFLIDSTKKDLKNSIILLVAYAFLLIISIIAIVLWGTLLSVFIICATIAVIVLFLALKKLRKLNLSDYKTISGEIVDVLKQSTTQRSITGGYGMYVTRKYDAFAKAAIRLTVSLKNENDVHSYVMEGVTEEHANYYEAKGNAIHIWGTHFPVKLDMGKEKWLCPICGEFNPNKEKHCTRCKKKVIK